MTTTTRSAVAALIVAAGTVIPVGASGPIGIYAVIDKVVFEPSEEAPERVRVYGAFAFYDGTSGGPGATTEPARGYMYFRLGVGDAELVRNEWSDLAAVAGTGEAVAFGRYAYIGRFDGLRTDAPSPNAGGPPYVLEPDGPNGTAFASQNLSVRDESEALANPASYAPSGIGVVRLGVGHPEIVATLRRLANR